MIGQGALKPLRVAEFDDANDHIAARLALDGEGRFGTEPEKPHGRQARCSGSGCDRREPARSPGGLHRGCTGADVVTQFIEKCRLESVEAGSGHDSASGAREVIWSW